MDNFFQILIYLIIIIAFLNSVLKKKDKGKPADSSQRRAGPYSSPESESHQHSQEKEYDILREIEGLFKNETPVPVEIRKRESSIEASERQRVTVEKKEYAEHEESSAEHELDQSWHKITSFKRTPKINSTIEKEAENFEHILESLHREEDFPLGEFREKLHSMQTLREFIIMSEILGKPKYLRR
ncbi:MAG TPA: hypothetical protein VLB50_06695 [Ignavibacteriaceae bacterium]|nr:hypothetical protein [Ignavibacteriaceae bacterium]